jgi:regulator of sigma E protease
MGVSYIPCVVGKTLAGDPEWQAGVEPGDKIIQLGDGRRDEQLRFRRDLRLTVFTAGAGNNLQLLLRRREGTEESITVRPNSPLAGRAGIPTIGVLSAASNRLNQTEPVFEDTPAAAAQPALKGGDTIVGVELDGRRKMIQDGLALEDLLTRYRDRELKLLIDRSSSGGSSGTSPVKPEEIAVTLAPDPVRHLGLNMTMGRITAIAAGSPADDPKVDLRVGDIVRRVHGQPIADPLSLGNWLQNLAGQTVVVEVEREGEPELVAVPVNLRQSDEQLLATPVMRRGAPAVAQALGIAFEVDHVVRDVLPGSSAAKAGMQPGDVVTKVEFVGQSAERPSLVARIAQKPIVLVEQHKETGEVRQHRDWPYVHDVIQLLAPGAKVKLTYSRGEQSLSTTLAPFDTSDWFNTDRGLNLQQMSETRTAGSFVEACQLGLRETKEGLLQVFIVLGKLSQSWRSLGGPGTIAVAATSEASAGVPRLLIFLTLLSANLAVLNFLPIPVLDGGHMMFLAYEGISGKPVNERLAFGLTLLGLSFILCLMVFVIGLDVARFYGMAG